MDRYLNNKNTQIIHMGVNTMLNLMNLQNISQSSQRMRIKIIWINGCEEEKDVLNTEFISHGAVLELTLSNDVHEYIPILQIMKIVATKY
jgi:hypothetical protein